ncbi:N-terminal domain of NEFA-interacting nuclear protein NIP30-domain-containing protein [Podospora australis]|uniref:N-terminal domain of NEFA-interacting nuclear protein NIP30-domain-containing protein n=1 Tax=Podospora australis TaxID=1536484 RepID=A0AAN7AJW6_9PEZI|nr:N-terminal domain of NEFA-interacting nuclear protein NIP30-domain-containing protein [Podospora australis]
MSSRFVSAGAIDAATGEAAAAAPTTSTSESNSSNNKKSQEWAQVTQQLEEERRKREEAHRRAAAGEEEKSLYEVLQANKAAKQAAFEEAHKIKNQFRALDDDEIDFLDDVLRKKREEEEKARKELEEGLEAFRRANASKSGGDIPGEEEGEDWEEDWEFAFSGGTKRRRGQGGEGRGKRVKGLAGVRRKGSADDTGSKAGETKEEGKVGEKQKGDVKVVKEAEAKAEVKSPAPAPVPAPPPAKKPAGPLVDYGSDSDD